MPPVSILLNVLWIVFGGFWMAAGWVVADSYRDLLEDTQHRAFAN